MNCPRCGAKTSASIPYCNGCGSKLDLTADEIRSSLVEKAHEERLQSKEYYAKQALFFSVVVFLIAVTLFVMAGGEVRQAYPIPSALHGTRYAAVRYSVQDGLELPKGVVPFTGKRK